MACNKDLNLYVVLTLGMVTRNVYIVIGKLSVCSADTSFFSFWWGWEGVGWQILTPCQWHMVTSGQHCIPLLVSVLS